MNENDIATNVQQLVDRLRAGTASAEDQDQAAEVIFQMFAENKWEMRDAELGYGDQS